jgi:hypothetical protein
MSSIAIIAVAVVFGLLGYVLGFVTGFRYAIWGDLRFWNL